MIEAPCSVLWNLKLQNKSQSWNLILKEKLSLLACELLSFSKVISRIHGGSKAIGSSLAESLYLYLGVSVKIDNLCVEVDKSSF